jgi:PqqD family protein of HPr-rel-A system
MSNYTVSENIAISDSGFVFHPVTGETFTLNPIGKEILTQIQKGNSLENITQEITEKFDVEKIEVERDLDDFLSQLINYGVIKEI